MTKRQKILEKHPYKITYNEKRKRWYTRFDYGDKKDVQRNRKTKKEIEDLIVEFYESGEVLEGRKSKDDEPEEPKFTFSKAYDRWYDIQVNEYCKNDNTIYKYEHDWKRFFQGTEFVQKEFLKINSKDIETFIIERIVTLNLKQRAVSTLYGIISGVYYTAVMDRLIDRNDNPCDYVDRKKFYRYYNRKYKTQDQRIYSKEELRKLIKRLDDDVEEKPKRLFPYGVRLSLLTGMRRGEICGLRWKNVLKDRIVICESEKYNQLRGEYYQSDTKTGKIRSIPITPEIQEFLNDMRNLQAKYGSTEDFVISTAAEKLRTNNLSNYLVRTSHQLGFDSVKNIHAIRRTFNSHMRQSGTTATIAGSIIGNSAEVNDTHYTYDICDIDTKKKLVADTEKRMLSGVL